jgi:hypothetical protein
MIIDPSHEPEVPLANLRRILLLSRLGLRLVRSSSDQWSLILGLANEIPKNSACQTEKSQV